MRVTVKVTIGASRVTVPRQIWVPAAEERPQGGHGAGYNSKVNFNGGPDVCNVVGPELFSEVQESVHIDKPDDSNDRNSTCQACQYSVVDNIRRRE